MINEPDVSLTDYGLALECAAFAWMVFKGGGRSRLAGWFTLFFVSLSLGALFGGTVHGFFDDETSAGYKILWPGSLVSIGTTALAVWGIASASLSAGTARLVSRMAVLLFVSYVGTILFVTQAFWVAIADYLPPALFLLAVWTRVYLRTRAKPVLTGVAGLGLTFAAAGVQVEKVAIHPVYFNHNALYHLIQAAALFMIFSSARWFTSERKEEGI